ncbi:S8 family peptidase [Paenibacillus pinihumi]|uniref:S8 family peptidase n=1 Tax=Paenibacillus pinihumi TaxID=669462 RepID=UPI000410A855|nr:S8 family serine peptidase [Paenibacillus pinihumi]
MNPLIGDVNKNVYTGRYIVTFRQDAIQDGMRLLNNLTGVKNIPTTSDFIEGNWNIDQVKSAKGAVYEKLGVAVIEADEQQMMQLQMANEDEKTSIIAYEPELMMHAIEDLNPIELNNGNDANIPLSYIKGCRDEIDSLYQRLVSGDLNISTTDQQVMEVYEDTSMETWGLQATNVNNSQYSGRGIRVAVLDTGFDFSHPDFRGRRIESQSFVSGETVQDVHGHGTHCIGTACGARSNTGQRYGVAYESEIYVGKVLGNSGNGDDMGVLAGIEWALSNNCHIISMSLGPAVPICTTTIAYEQVGQRALQQGGLIIAAAGNTANRGRGNFSCVGRPANSKSIMAVAALNNRLQAASFSPRSGNNEGGEIDIAAPGVRIFSSWTLPNRYKIIDGTSMATPHVSGIAALFAEAYQARGYQLWQLLSSNARRLSLPNLDVGAGIVQAP